MFTIHTCEYNAKKINVKLPKFGYELSKQHKRLTDKGCTLWARWAGRGEMARGGKRRAANGDVRGEVNTINVRSERKRRPNRNAAQTNLSWKLSCAPIKLINWPSQA